MPRSLKKGPFVDQKLLAKIDVVADAGSDRKPIKTWSRKSMITPDFVSHNFAVHNGKDFIQLRVSEEMIGHKLGEFSPTTKFSRHGGKMQKELEKGQEQAGVPVPAPKAEVKK